MDNKRLSKDDKYKGIGCLIFLILFILIFFLLKGCFSEDNRNNRTKNDISNKAFYHRQDKIDTIVMNALKFINRNDSNAIKRYVHASIESARFMTLVTTDKDYDDAIILYPYDYLEQESYYMEKKNDKPIYAKFDEFEKNGISTYYDNMQSEADDRIRVFLK